MSRLLRFGILAVFGAIGVALAVWLASDVQRAGGVLARSARGQPEPVDIDDSTPPEAQSHQLFPQQISRQSENRSASTAAGLADSPTTPQTSTRTQASAESGNSKLLPLLKQSLQQALQGVMERSCVLASPVSTINSDQPAFTFVQGQPAFGMQASAGNTTAYKTPLWLELGRALLGGSSTQTAGQAAPSEKPGKSTVRRAEGGISDRSQPDSAGLIIEIQNEDILVVLDMLAKEGQLNILPSKSVQGTVSATLHNVDVETALEAIVKAAGFALKREGNFIFVGTPQELQTFEKPYGKLGTRIYRTKFVPAAELQALIQPLLTEGVGAVSVTSPAETGIQSDDTQAGGDSYAGADTLIVRDYEPVLQAIDQIIAAIDIPPEQVAIEAMILSVEIDDDDKLGVDFELLRNRGHIRFALGVPIDKLEDMNFQGGLKIGFVDSSISAVLEALETMRDTNVIAAPRLMVLNKHRAAIQIGKQQGYVSTTITETAASQSVEFLDTGTLLRLRPFICGDNMIRMEIHPELSDGEVQELAGFTVPHKDITQVTTNVMVPDGCTVIIGGLFREQLVADSTQVPFFGNLPLLGHAFRHRTEQVQREEIIILLTPHIVRNEIACAEGRDAYCQFKQRQAVNFEKFTPLGKRHAAQRFMRLAQSAWAKGNWDAALRFAELAVHFDPESREAIRLRSAIWQHLTPTDQLLPAEEILEEVPGDIPGQSDSNAAAQERTNSSTNSSGKPPLDSAQLPPQLLQQLAARVTKHNGGRQHPQRPQNASSSAQQFVVKAAKDHTPVVHSDYSTAADNSQGSKKAATEQAQETHDQFPVMLQPQAIQPELIRSGSF